MDGGNRIENHQAHGTKTLKLHVFWCDMVCSIPRPILQSPVLACLSTLFDPWSFQWLLELLGWSQITDHQPEMSLMYENHGYPPLFCIPELHESWCVHVVHVNTPCSAGPKNPGETFEQAWFSNITARDSLKQMRTLPRIFAWESQTARHVHNKTFFQSGKPLELSATGSLCSLFCLVDPETQIFHWVCYVWYCCSQNGMMCQSQIQNSAESTQTWMDNGLYFFCNIRFQVLETWTPSFWLLQLLRNCPIGF